MLTYRLPVIRRRRAQRDSLPRLREERDEVTVA